MNAKSLYLVVVLGLTAAACDDGSPSRPRDAGGDTRPADGGVDVADSAPPKDGASADGAVDRSPDVTSVDRAPDTTVDAPDAAPDQATDTGADMAADLAPDSTADTGPDSSSDAGDAGDASPEMGGDASTDAVLPVALHGCGPMDYQDKTAAGADRDLTWTAAIAGDIDRCIKIKVGQSVTWTGNLSNHPLAPLDGTAPSPIVPISSGASVTYTFNAPGTFGYHCTVHPPMKGAVYVSP